MGVSLASVDEKHMAASSQGQGRTIEAACESDADAARRRCDRLKSIYKDCSGEGCFDYILIITAVTGTRCCSRGIVDILSTICDNASRVLIVA